MIVRFTRLALCAVALIPGCASPRWDGKVTSWGEMRPVMRDGQSEARVRLGDALARPHAFGVGAVESLRGEIVIDDGRCWVGAVSANQSLRVMPEATATNATLLIVAYVPKWKNVRIDRPLPAEELDLFLHNAALRFGLNVNEPFPFVIEGELRNLSAHVVNGYCPMTGSGTDAADATRPYQINEQSIRGKLIGLYAADSAGRLTHHGTESHIHVLVETVPSLVGHVEQVSVEPGAILRLPAQ